MLRSALLITRTAMTLALATMADVARGPAADTGTRTDTARALNTSWATVPLFAHFRIANFTEEDVATMGATLRSATVQGTLFGGVSGERQAAEVRRMLAPAGTPTFIYRNLYYSQPWDHSNAAMKAHPSWQLDGPDGKPLNPEGKLVYNMTEAAVQAFYTSCIANLSILQGIDGAFGDSGCGKRPAWMPGSQQALFAQGQQAAAAASQAALAKRGGVFIQNCPYLPKGPAGVAPDPWPAGVQGVMYESWCSDFLTGEGGGPGVASFCRDEILEVLSGPAAWGNGSIIQARYYLSGHNGADPRFGAVAFMVAAYPGAFFGASAGWDWAGDFSRQSSAPWAKQRLGLAGAQTHPRMLDHKGCGWARTFDSGATVFLNLCFARGHPMSAHAVWADNTTWPASLGAARAAAVVASHRERVGAADKSPALPAGFALHPLPLPVSAPSGRRAAPTAGGAATAMATAVDGGRTSRCSVGARVRGTLVVGPDGSLNCLVRA